MICLIFRIRAKRIATERILLLSASETAKSRGVDKDFFKVRNYISNNRDKGNKCNKRKRCFNKINFKRFRTLFVMYIFKVIFKVIFLNMHEHVVNK